MSVGHDLARRMARLFRLRPSAVGWQLLSIFCLATMAALVKLLGASQSFQEIVLYRSWLGWILLLPLFGWRVRPWGRAHATDPQNNKDTGRNPAAPVRIGIGGHMGVRAQKRSPWALAGSRVIILRAFFNIAALLCGFYAVIHIPLTVSATISFSRTFYVIILGALVLGDPVHRRHWLAALIGFIGIIVLLRPGIGDAYMDIGIAFSLAGAFFVACGTVATRFLSQRQEALSILFWNGFYVALLALPLIAWHQHGLDPIDALMMVMITLAGMAGQFCNIISLGKASIGDMAPYSYLRVLFASVYGYFFFSYVPDLWTWIGALIIIGANIYASRSDTIPRRGLTTGD